jgi:plastocyanin domain-containing protein
MEKPVIVSVGISLALIIGVLYAVSDRPAPKGQNETAPSENIAIRDGVQYVTVTARSGYSPRVTQMKSGIPTKLVVKTDGTYDCSASLVVRSAGFQKVLPPTGEEVIDLGTPQSGEEVHGVCGMGMYAFRLYASDTPPPPAP